MLRLLCAGLLPDTVRALQDLGHKRSLSQCYPQCSGQRSSAKLKKYVSGVNIFGDYVGLGGGAPD